CAFTIEPEAGDGHVNQVVADGPERRSIDTQLLRDACRLVDDNRVAFSGEAIQNLQTFRLGIIERNALLVPVDAREPERLAIQKGRPPCPRIVSRPRTL